MLSIEMERMKKWYSDRIERGEMSLNGWTTRHSQKVRFAATMRMLLMEYEPPMNIVDFGCGTASFYGYARMALGNYLGIEIREEARRQARKILTAVAKNTPVDVSVRKSLISKNWSVDAVIANGNFGFEQQDLIKELDFLVAVYDPKAIIVDLFSELRPYEPSDTIGYKAYNPHTLLPVLVKHFPFKRWAVDHSYLSHVFTFGLFR